MTASPPAAPARTSAKIAQVQPAVPGVPGEETLARWLCAREGHTPEQVDGLWPEWLDNALELLAMFRPAFEAKDAEIGFLRAGLKREREAHRETIRQMAAINAALEAKLAQAVEAKDAEIERLKLVELKIHTIVDRAGFTEATTEDAVAALADRALSAEAKLAQAVEAVLSLSEKLTKAETEIAAMGGARATYFDGELIICHPDMPPHIWDGKKMIRVKFEPAASAIRGEKT